MELATLKWVHWFNHGRFHESIWHVPPAEAEADYWRQVANTVRAGACTSTNYPPPNPVRFNWRCLLTVWAAREVRGRAERLRCLPAGGRLRGHPSNLGQMH